MTLWKKIKISNDKYQSMTENQLELPCGFVFNYESIKCIDSKSYVNCKLCLKVHFVEILKLKKDKNFKEFLCEHFQEIERNIEIHRELVKRQVDEKSNEIIEQAKESGKKFLKKSKTIHDQNELEILKKEVTKLEFSCGALTQKLDFLIRIDKLNMCKLWNIETNECLKSIQLQDDNKIWIHKFLKPYSLLALCNDDLFRVFDLTTGLCLKSFPVFDDVNEHFSNNQVVVMSSKIIAMDTKQKIYIYNLENACLEKVFDLEDESEIAVRIFAFLDNLNFLYGFYHAAKPIKLVDYASGNLIQTYSGHNEPIKSVNILLDRKRFVSSSFNQIKIWNIETGECVKSILNDEFHYSKCLILTQNGKLVNLSPEDSLSIWDTLDDFKWLCEYRYPNFKPTYIIKPLNEDKILSYYNDRRILIWDLRKCKCLSVFDSGMDDFNYKLEFCPFL